MQSKIPEKFRKMFKVRGDLTGQAVPALYTLMLVCIPFNTGPTIEYILIFLLIAACIWHLRGYSNDTVKLISLSKKIPLTWTVGLFVVACTFSIFTSIDPSYSFKQFLDEIVLKFSLYFVFSLYCATIPPTLKWLDLIIKVNILFLVVYFYVMFQWLLMPTHPVFIPTGLKIINWSIQDIIFRYGNITTLIHDTKHTGLFLLLGMAASSVPVLWHKRKNAYAFMFLINFLAIITAIRRSHMIAALIGLGLAVLFRPDSFKRVALIITAAFATLLLTGTYLYHSGKINYLVHEDWNKVISGKIEPEGSVFLRIIASKLYGEKMLEHPFRGVGLGKKNIKEAYPDVYSEIKLGHPHNIILNIACETGIQGAIALVLLIGAQTLLFIKAFKKTESEKIKVILVTGLVYMCMFWLVQMATYGFRHGPATLYWLFTAIPTGMALKELNRADQAIDNTPLQT